MGNFLSNLSNRPVLARPVTLTGVSNKSTNTAQYSFVNLRNPIGMVGQSPSAHRAIKNNPGVTLRVIPGRVPNDNLARAGKLGSIFSRTNGYSSILGTQQAQAHNPMHRRQ